MLDIIIDKVDNIQHKMAKFSRENGNYMGKIK